MATRPLRPCNRPGCPALVASGYCAAHAPKRASAFQRGYNDRAYHAWRNAVLARDPNCRICDAPGQKGDHADHIVPVRSGGARYDVDNGQRLCSSCHASIKQVEDNKLPKYLPPKRPTFAPVFG